MEELIVKTLPAAGQGEKYRNIGGLIPLSSIVQIVYDQVTGPPGSMRKSQVISTGLSDLDAMIHGINKSDLLLIAAQPGMGKSILALNMALFAGMSLEKTVAVFSLDKSREQLVSRFFARTALIPFQSLQACKLNERQWHDFVDAANNLKSANIYIDDTPSLNVSDIAAQCRRIQNLDLVVIDYLQLIQSAVNCHDLSAENRVYIKKDICRMVKDMATELDIPVICTSTLSQSVKSRCNKRPILSDLHDSGVNDQYADVVIGLYRDSFYNEKSENRNQAEAIVLKNNNGATGTVALTWFPEYMTFCSVEPCYKERKRSV